MNRTIWIFGDSWSWGWAGGHPTPSQYKNRYSLLFAKYLNINKIEDHSHAGWSFGQIVESFLNNSNNIKKDDIVFVTIPPDSRGYIAKENVNQMATLFHSDDKFVKLLELNNYNLYYFTYHINLFITLISDFCNRIGAECIMQHNYGTLELLEWCKTDSILDIKNSMWNWIGLPTNYDITKYKSGDGPRISTDTNYINNHTDLFEKYLIKMNGVYDLHPNELGHKLIFEKIVDIYESKKELI